MKSHRCAPYAHASRFIAFRRATALRPKNLPSLAWRCGMFGAVDSNPRRLRMIVSRSTLLGATAAGGACLSTDWAWSQSYPSRPIR